MSMRPGGSPTVMMGGVLRVTVNAMTWPTLAPKANAYFTLFGTGNAALATASKSNVPEAPNVTNAHRGPGTVNHAMAVIAAKMVIVKAVPRSAISFAQSAAFTSFPC